MLSINLDEFVEKVQDYQKNKQENQYRQMLERHNILDRLERIDEAGAKILLKFLNQWKCRVKYDCAPRLARTIQECSESISTFDKHRLKQVSLEFLIAGSDTVQEIFKKIASVRSGQRHVGTPASSKILHLANPHFFMMYDKNIRYEYGCSDNELGYVNFMWRMKLFGDVVIRKYSTLRKVPIDSSFARLVSECKSASTTLPKLLDEFNWVKFNT